MEAFPNQSDQELRDSRADNLPMERLPRLSINLPDAPQIGADPEKTGDLIRIALFDPIASPAEAQSPVKAMADDLIPPPKGNQFSGVGFLLLEIPDFDGKRGSRRDHREHALALGFDLNDFFQVRLPKSSLMVLNASVSGAVSRFTGNGAFSIIWGAW